MSAHYQIKFGLLFTSFVILYNTKPNAIAKSGGRIEMDTLKATRDEYIKRLEAAVRQARTVEFMPVKLRMALELLFMKVRMIIIWVLEQHL